MHIITGLLVSALLGKSSSTNSKTGRKPVGFHGVLEVRHFIPGRIRYWAPKLSRRGEQGEELTRGLPKVKGVTSVTVSEVTGSILVRFDPGALSRDIITAALIHLLELDDEVNTRPVPTLSKELHGMADALNQAVYEKTGGLIDLWTTIPLALGGLGIYKMLQPGGLSFPTGFTLLWWAYMSFFDKSEKS